MDPLSRRHDSFTAAQSVVETEGSGWAVPDLIDFDYYVDDDERVMRERPAERRQLAERDRRLYLERIRDDIPASMAEHDRNHRGAVLRRWLALRRNGEHPALRPLLPGASFARGQRLVTIGLGLLGLIVGGGVASALLQYDGSHPVNVAWYLFVLVLLQTLLAGTAVAAWALRRSRPVRTAMQDVSLLSNLIRPLLARAAGWVQRQRLARESADVRDRAKARAGLLQSHHALYGPASYLPVLIPVQVFGIAFNIGAVAVTVALEWFSDLAFGWGSALDVEPRTIYDLARFVALPWGWAFGEGVGYPSLEQIAGSRIVLKDALSVLDAGHLRSWRWFLVLAVLTYGLIPRLVLLGLSVLTQTRTLNALPFTHQRTQALYARLLTPSLAETAARSGSGPGMPIPEPLKPPQPGSPSVSGTAIGADACVLMIQLDVADVLEDADHGRLQRMLHAHSGWRVAASVTIGGGSAMADQAVALLRDRQWEAPPPRIAIVQDGSQPPITENLRFLRRVRAAAGTQAQILLALVGDPDDDDVLPPLSAFDFGDWKRKIDQMGDPYLRLEMLAPPVAAAADSASNSRQDEQG